MLHKIEQTALKELPDWQKRWASVKLFERDETATVGLFLPEDTLQRIETEIAQVEEERADDSESIITGERYDAVTDKMEQLAKSRGRVSMTMSDKIDRIVTNRWLGLPIFALIMMLVYYVSITTVGTAMTDWVNDGLFGDGWHLFGNGTAAYEEAVTGYAEEHIWTPDWMREAEAAAAAEIAGAEDVVGAAQEKTSALSKKRMKCMHPVSTKPASPLPNRPMRPWKRHRTRPIMASGYLGFPL